MIGISWSKWPHSALSTGKLSGSSPPLQSRSNTKIWDWQMAQQNMIALITKGECGRDNAGCTLHDMETAGSDELVWQISFKWVDVNFMTKETSANHLLLLLLQPDKYQIPMETWDLQGQAGLNLWGSYLTAVAGFMMKKNNQSARNEMESLLTRLKTRGRPLGAGTWGKPLKAQCHSTRLHALPLLWPPDTVKRGIREICITFVDLIWSNPSGEPSIQLLTNGSKRISKCIQLIANNVIFIDIWSGFIRHSVRPCLRRCDVGFSRWIGRWKRCWTLERDGVSSVGITPVNYKTKLLITCYLTRGVWFFELKTGLHFYHGLWAPLMQSLQARFNYIWASGNQVKSGSKTTGVQNQLRQKLCKTAETHSWAKFGKETITETHKWPKWVPHYNAQADSGRALDVQALLRLAQALVELAQTCSDLLRLAQTLLRLCSDMLTLSSG